MNYIDVAQMMKLAAEKQIPIYNQVAIQNGATLGGLAKQYNTTVDHLARVNHIADPNKIRTGKLLLVPAAKKFDVNTPLADDVADRVIDQLWTIESSRGKMLSNPNSTARGHFHWLNGTWQDFQKKYPNETKGMTQSSLDDYDTAAKFQKMKLQDDALRYQKATGKQVTDKDLYAIHYGGFGGRNKPAAIQYANTAADPDLKKKRGFK